MLKKFSISITLVLMFMFGAVVASAAQAPVFNDFTTGAEGWSPFQATQTINENHVLIATHTSGGYLTVSNSGVTNRTTWAEGDRPNPYFVQGLVGGGDPGGSMTWKVRVYNSAGTQVDSADGVAVSRTDPTQVAFVNQVFEPGATPSQPGRVALNMAGGVWPAGGSLEIRISYAGIETGDRLEIDYIEQRFLPGTPPPNQPPVANFTFAPSEPDVDELVTFNSTSSDPDGAADIVKHEWDVDGDGTYDITQGGLPATTDEAYQASGNYNVTLRVTDAQNNTHTATKTVPVTDPAPPPPPTAPSDPTGFVWDEASTTETTCVWEWNDNPASENATYQQYPFTSPTTWSGTWTDIGSTSRFELSGLSPGTTRYLKVSAGNAQGFSNWVPNSPDPAVACTTDGVVPPPPPPPGNFFEDPFKNSPTMTPALQRQNDSNSEGLVDAFIDHASTTNGSRGPGTFVPSARYRGTASDPLWTICGAQGCTTARAPANMSDSGGVDPTLGVFDETTRKHVRLYCGDSGQCSYPGGFRVNSSFNIGVDLNDDGDFRDAGEFGNGTAWGRSSDEGGFLPREALAPTSMIGFSFGNNRNARAGTPGAFRYPALSQESKAVGPAYNPTPGALTGLPAGTTLCHVWPQSTVDAEIARAGFTGSLLTFARSVWRTLSCAEGRGAVNKDGTGDGGIIFYVQDPEWQLSNAQTRAAFRVQPVNSGNQVSILFRDRSMWRAKTPLAQ